MSRMHLGLELEHRLALSSRLISVLSGTDLTKLMVKTGVKDRSIRNYLAGKIPELAPLAAIAGACGVSLNWLVSGIGPRDLHPTIIPNDEVDDHDRQSQFLSDTGKSRYVAIPRLNIAASAGGGALAEHAQVVEYLAFDADFVRTRLRRDPKHLVLIEARGDSMEPTIRDGDILTVDVSPDQSLQSSTLYVIRIDEALLVKRLDRRIDGSIIVHSDNLRYPPETVPRDLRAELHILGQVILVSAPPR